MKQVFVATDVTEAYLVKGVLESHGISAAVRGEHLWGVRGEVPFVDTWPTVWILDDTLEADARAVIADYGAGKARVAAPGSSWRCPKCGEELESQFTACWACGAERPA